MSLTCVVPLSLRPRPRRSASDAVAIPFPIGCFPQASLGTPFPTDDAAVVGTPFLLLEARKMRLTARDRETIEGLLARLMLAVEAELRCAPLTLLLVLLDMRLLDVLARGRRVDAIPRPSCSDDDDDGDEGSSGGLRSSNASISMRWTGARAQRHKTNSPLESA